MTVLEIYVKNSTNSEGMPLTRFVLLSPQWKGTSLRLPFGEEGEEQHNVVGWTDLIFNNPYPDSVRGCPTTIHCAKVEQGEHVGFLVWGGNLGVRVGGRNGWGQPIIWINNVDDLPIGVRRVVTIDTK